MNAYKQPEQIYEEAEYEVSSSSEDTVEIENEQQEQPPLEHKDLFPRITRRK